MFMSCPFCEAFACYRRQLGRRLDTGTFSLSEANAQLLMNMAAQIRNVTRTTVRLVDNESVPTMLCDLLDGLAEGLIEGLACKLAVTRQPNGHAASTAAAQPSPDGERQARPASHRG